MHLFAHLATDVAQALHAVDALRLKPAVAQHAQHLSVFGFRVNDLGFFGFRVKGLRFRV